jgi:hypothetical protein
LELGISRWFEEVVDLPFGCFFGVYIACFIETQYRIHPPPLMVRDACVGILVLETLVVGNTRRDFNIFLIGHDTITYKIISL